MSSERFMNSDAKCYTGGCLCGALRYEAVGEPLGSGRLRALKTEAPIEAVICSPAMLDDRYGEAEYLVDRRRLRQVDIAERFSQRAV